MLREDEKQPKPVTINCLVCDGGAGDLLAYLVVVNHMIKHIPWVKPIVWVPDYLLEFAKNVLPPEANLNDFTKAKAGKYNEKLIGVTTQWNKQHTPMRVHPVDYAAHMMLDGDLKPEEKNYLKFNPEGTDLTKFALPEKYVVLSVGATTKTKEMPAETMTQIIDHVISKGYTPVFIGKEESDGGGQTGKIKANLAKVDYTKGIDLTNKTTICEAAAIISGAKAFIGMEGGLTHLAAYTEVPIVAGYTIVSPEQMMPTRHNEKGWNVYPVVAEESLACRFCQTNSPLLYSANYYYCYYDDYKCIKQMTFEKWKEQIDKAL